MRKNRTPKKAERKSPGAPGFEETVIDLDGSLAPTYGECKEGMALSYHGEWGYSRRAGTPA